MISVSSLKAGPEALQTKIKSDEPKDLGTENFFSAYKS
jgi:hypothetical protein